MVIRFIAIVFLSYIALFLSAPKLKIYYTLSSFLETNSITINNEQFDDGLLSLQLLNPQIKYNGVQVGEAKEIRFYNLLIYNKALFVDFNLLPLADEKSLLKFDKLNASWSIFSPKVMKLDFMSSYGDGSGIVDFNAHTIKIYFNDENQITTIKKYLKSDEQGWYYEKSL
ncbi:MAG: hypothetical protein KN64_13315 [Sulfurovum sp. AS07-7]|nr:MAG: hypothetical protein KN64_13315 [Sulfurovum sp. AS07-7]